MKFRAYVAIRFTIELEVEADDAEAATQKIKEMDGRQLLEDAKGPEIEVEDIVSAARTKRRPR